MMEAIANHLWQSTVCGGVVWLLTLALRNNRASARYGLWLAASVKFLVPFSWLVAAGSRLGWRTVPAWSVVEEVSRPFGSTPIVHAAAAPQGTAGIWPAILTAVWLCGFAASAVAWFRCWRRMRRVMREATALPNDLPMRAMWSAEAIEPGVFGVVRPVLLLPQGIVDRLTPAQFAAVLAHELCHVRRRDNLTGALHTMVEAILWFHPLVWWIRERLAEERERACDEAVLDGGTDPHAYAEGILRVCRLYLEAPRCVAGVTGGALRRRIERIVAGQAGGGLSWPKKWLLGAVGLAAVAVPFAAGVATGPATYAQTPAGAKPRLAFEVASVKPAPRDAEGRSLSHRPGARLTTSNATVKQLIYIAYEVMPYQLSGGPDWVGSDGFDVDAKAADPHATPAQFREMVQTLLVERFHLQCHMTTKEMPIYTLLVAKNGPKLREAKKQEDAPDGVRNNRGTMTGVKATMAMFATALTRPLQRGVVDETGLKGTYTFEVKFDPEENPASDNPPLLDAVREQLGLVLKPSRGPVPVLVIDGAERPAAN